MTKCNTSRVEALERRAGPAPLIVAFAEESADEAISRYGMLSPAQRRRAIVVHTGVPTNLVWTPE